jgi:hypothetical protein
MTASLRSEIIEPAAALLVDRLLANESGKPDGLADPTPLVDRDGDLRCPLDGRVFVTPSGFKQHVTKSHNKETTT